MSENKLYQVTTNPLETGPYKASLYLTTKFKDGLGSEFIADFENEAKANEVGEILNKSLVAQSENAPNEIIAALQKFVSHHEAGLLPDRFVYEQAKKALEGNQGKGYTTAYIPCAEYDPEMCGGFTSNDGRSLCYVKEIKAPL